MSLFILVAFFEFYFNENNDEKTRFWQTTTRDRGIGVDLFFSLYQLFIYNQKVLPAKKI